MKPLLEVWEERPVKHDYDRRTTRDEDEKRNGELRPP